MKKILLISLLAVSGCAEADVGKHHGHDLVCRTKEDAYITFKDVTFAELADAGTWRIVYRNKGKIAWYMQEQGETCMLMPRPYINDVTSLENYGA